MILCDNIFFNNKILHQKLWELYILVLMNYIIKEQKISLLSASGKW